jgi:hypothetical protein
MIQLQHDPALLALCTMSIVAVHRGRDDLLIQLTSFSSAKAPAKSSSS